MDTSTFNTTLLTSIIAASLIGTSVMVGGCATNKPYLSKGYSIEQALNKDVENFRKNYDLSTPEKSLKSYLKADKNHDDFVIEQIFSEAYSGLKSIKINNIKRGTEEFWDGSKVDQATVKYEYKYGNIEETLKAEESFLKISRKAYNSLNQTKSSFVNYLRPGDWVPAKTVTPSFWYPGM